MNSIKRLFQLYPGKCHPAATIDSFQAFWRVLDRGKRYLDLFQIVRKVCPKSIVEIGVHNADTAAVMIWLSTLGSGQRPSAVHYYGFDLFEEMTASIRVSEISRRAPTLKHVQRKLNLTGAHVALFKGDSKNTLPDFINQQRSPVDLIYVDGGHSFETVERDWRNIQSIVGEQTVVVFDDYTAPSVGAVNEESSCQQDFPAGGTWGCNSVIDGLDRERFCCEILSTIDRYSWGEDRQVRVCRNS